MPSGEAPPSAVTAACPDCGGETLHAVLKGTMGTRGAAATLDATVRCEECGRVHHVVLREARDVEVPVVVSRGATSRRTHLRLPGDEEVSEGEIFVVDGVRCRVSSVETRDLRRVPHAPVPDVLTLWMTEFEALAVGFAINLGKKTITKTVAAPPEREFSVGEEHVFGRLRVTVHAIKTKERLLKRGTAPAQDIVRIFARPTPLGGEKPRPDKRTREELRAREERRGRR